MAIAIAIAVAIVEHTSTKLFKLSPMIGYLNIILGFIYSWVHQIICILIKFISKGPRFVKKKLGDGETDYSYSKILWGDFKVIYVSYIHVLTLRASVHETSII